MSNIDKGKLIEAWNYVMITIRKLLRDRLPTEIIEWEEMESEDIKTNKKISDENPPQHNIEFIVFVSNELRIDQIHDIVLANQSRNAKFVCYILLVLGDTLSASNERLSGINEIVDNTKFGFVATKHTLSKKLEEALEEHGLITPEKHGLIFSHLLCLLSTSIFF